MLISLIVAAIIGLCVAAYVIREMRRSSKVASFRGKTALCPHLNEQSLPCGANLSAVGVWKRTGVFGEIFDCATCGNISHWDMTREPPVLKRKQRQPISRRKKG